MNFICKKTVQGKSKVNNYFGCRHSKAFYVAEGVDWLAGLTQMKGQMAGAKMCWPAKTWNVGCLYSSSAV